MSTLLAFFSGTLGRMIWGEFSHWLTAWLEHRQELQRLEQQEKFSAAQHKRNMEALEKQHALQVEIVREQSTADILKLDTEAWAASVVSANRITGVRWLDAWNGAIRPTVATWSLLALSFAEFGVITLSDDARLIAGAALGLYIAERGLFKRGKQ